MNKNCAGCAFRKSHLAVLVAICNSQLAVHKKNFEKAAHKDVDEIDPWTNYFNKVTLVKERSSSSSAGKNEKINEKQNMGLVPSLDQL